MINPYLRLNDWCQSVHRILRAILSPQLHHISYHFASFPRYFPHSGHCSLSLAISLHTSLRSRLAKCHSGSVWYPTLASMVSFPLIPKRKQCLLFTGEELTAPHQVNAILRSGPRHTSTVSSIIHDEGPSLPSSRAQVHASPS